MDDPNIEICQIVNKLAYAEIKNLYEWRNKSEPLIA